MITGDTEADTSLVALHGIQGTRDSWLSVQLHLQHAIRWILPNLRGREAAFRGSGMNDYSLDAFASDVCATIQSHVGDTNFVLAGWSMGVSVALATLDMLKRQGQPLPQALILMSGSPVLKQTQWFRAEHHNALLQEIAAREQRLRLSKAADHDAVAWTWQNLRHSDQRALLGDINIPTLIVHGSEDEDSPFSHAQMLSAIRASRLECIPKAHHSILTEDAPHVARIMQAFLATLPHHGVTHA